jgi:hypothetical protein
MNKKRVFFLEWQFPRYFPESPEIIAQIPVPRILGCQPLQVGQEATQIVLINEHHNAPGFGSTHSEQQFPGMNNYKIICL